MVIRNSVLVFIIVITLQCASNNIKSHEGMVASFDLDLEATLDITEEYLVEIEISNNTESNIFLPNPGCYPISRLVVNEGEVSQQLAIRPSFKCAQNEFLRSNEKATYPYSYKLTELFNLIEGEEYRIELIYHSSIKNSDDLIFNAEMRDTITYVMK